jgi:ABC-type nitrate/sulfonate/bicarbonate transport system substrate-binding protein
MQNTKKFAEENPNTVRGVVKALNQGTKDTIADPDAALALLKDRDPMMKSDIEKIRLGLALDLTNTPHVQKHGLSVVDPKKLQYTIDATAAAYAVPHGARHSPLVLIGLQYRPVCTEFMARPQPSSSGLDAASHSHSFR